MKPEALKPVLEELRDFDTALLANTLGYVDATPPREWYMGGSIRSVTPELGPTVGVAVTCEMDTSSPRGKGDAAGYWRQLDQMVAMKVPAVWVVKAVGSRPDHECILGDGMAKTLFASGCLGVVTDGGLRDVEGLRTVPFAAYCRGTTVHHCALRVKRINVPVKVGGITVRPGDVVHANAEGVIKIPAGALGTLAARAVQMRAFEHEAHLMLRRTDLRPREKQARVVKLIAKYGFADCVTARKR
jgi:regulator of RNase E activity RraA